MKMEGMLSDLQVAKRQTWDEKEKLSAMFEEERRKNLASKVWYIALMQYVSLTVQLSAKQLRGLC
jgi:hypothetical protein